MSVILSYFPAPSEKIIEHATGSTAHALRNIFGNFPIILTEQDFGKIEAMAEAFEGEQNPYVEIYDALERHGEIAIKATY